MPKKTKAQFSKGHEPSAGVNGKKTSQGRKNFGSSTLNKHKRRSWKRYKGQGKQFRMLLWHISDNKSEKELVQHLQT